MLKAGRRAIHPAWPVATRLRTYGVKLAPDAMAWCGALFADPDFRAWEQAAEAEPWALDATDRLYR